MHAASLHRSARLQRVDAFLADGAEHSTREIIIACDVCAVNSVIAELRENGRRIETRWHAGKCYYRRVDT